MTSDTEKAVGSTRTNRNTGTSFASDAPLAEYTLSTPEAVTPASDFPDGGQHAWLTVLGAFLALFCTFGQMNAFGTFQSWYATRQLSQFSPSTIAWIGSLQLWVFFFSGSLIGRAFDAYGPLWIMTAGALIYVFSIMMISISTQYYQFILCQGLLFGLGVGMMFYPSLASVSTHFSRYRGTALGIAMAGSGLGGVVFPVMLQHLFQKVGFGWAVRVSGFVCLACCLASLATVRSRLLPGKASGPWVNTETFKDTRFSLLAAGSFLVCLGIFIPYFYVVDYAHDHRVSPSLASYVLAVLNAGGVLGRIAPACLSDALGRFNTLTPAAFFSGLACLALWRTADTAVSVMLFAAFFGFFSGAFISLVTPCIAQISEVTEIGMRIGMLYTIISLPSLFGGPAAGALLVMDRGSYNGMIALAGSTIIAGSFLILGAKLKINSRIFAHV